MYDEAWSRENDEAPKFMIPTFEFVSALDIWIPSFYGPLARENGVALARFSVT